MNRLQKHPVDDWSGETLRELLLRVDARDFPADLEHLWEVEHVRYRETLRRIPPAASGEANLLDLGSSRPWLPYFQVLLGYRRIVLNTCYPESHFVDDGLTVEGAPLADVCMAVYDVEQDAFPHAADSFDVVLCLEVLEHLAVDPMAMMAEVNRVLKPSGAFVLTTPNAVRYANVLSMVLGDQPLGWAPFNGYDHNRHNREYTPAEIEQLLRDAGLTPVEVTTIGSKALNGKREVLRRAASLVLAPVRRCPARWRGDKILAVGRKTSTTVRRGIWQPRY
jgi:SAM-dependent methyltransferase